MTPTELIVPHYTQMLRALSAWLDKAQAQLGEEAAEALLPARLAPDMFPLATQVRFACVQAHEAVHRLRGEPLPPALEELLNEGRGAGERPGDMAAAQARIAEALALLGTLAPDALDARAAAPLELALPMGLTFDLTGEQYVRDWAMPQFNFHLMTAYCVLRSRGVMLGKVDYVPYMMPYLRTDIAPAG